MGAPRLNATLSCETDTSGQGRGDIKQERRGSAGWSDNCMLFWGIGRVEAEENAGRREHEFLNQWHSLIQMSWKTISWLFMN